MPQPTAYDLNFMLWGFPVRISIWFWLGSLLFGSGFYTGGEGSALPIILWVATCLVSILLHEMGHALAFRRFGVPARIVLHAFGGVAIPDSYSNPWNVRVNQRLHPQQSIFVSAAGPLVQLALAACIMLALAASGYQIWGPEWITRWLPPGHRMLPYNANLFTAFMLSVNIYWPLLNLMPVYPLDGGQIARSMFLINDRTDPIRHALMLSLAVGGGLAILGMMQSNSWQVILFGSLAFSNYQELAMHHGGGGFGRGF